MLAERGSAIPQPDGDEGERTEGDEDHRCDEPRRRIDAAALDGHLARRAGEHPVLGARAVATVERQMARQRSPMPETSPKAGDRSGDLAATAQKASAANGSVKGPTENPARKENAIRPPATAQAPNEPHARPLGMLIEV